MRRIVLPLTAFLIGCANLLAVDVELPSTPKPKPGPSAQPRQQATPVANATATPHGTAAPTAATPTQGSADEIPRYRPALLGGGPLSLINRISTEDLMKKGQKDGSLMFCCSVKSTGDVTSAWAYRGTPETRVLEEELMKRLNGTIMIPAIYDRNPVNVLFFGTITFAIVNGKPRLRIFANQEAEELKKESDFVGPQPFVGRESKFEGLHYPDDQLRVPISGLVELAMKIDADGNLNELQVVSEEPPLVGFRRAASEDFRVAKFIPAFRDGKPTACSITLPVCYAP